MRLFRFIIEGVVDSEVVRHDAHAYDLIASSLHPVTVDLEQWVPGDRAVDQLVDPS